MTSELLKKAKLLERDINSYKSFLKAYDSHYENYIKAVDYKGNENTTVTRSLSLEPELNCIIKKYFADKLESLEEEFKKLN